MSTRLALVVASLIGGTTPAGALANGYQKVVIRTHGGLELGNGMAAFGSAFNMGGVSSPFVTNTGSASGPNLASLSSFSSVYPTGIWYTTSGVNFVTPTVPPNSGADLAAVQEYQSFLNFRSGTGALSGTGLASVNPGFQTAAALASAPNHNSMAASAGLQSNDLADLGSYLSQSSGNQDLLAKALNLGRFLSQFVPGFKLDPFLDFARGLLNNSKTTSPVPKDSNNGSDNIQGLRTDIQALRGEIRTLTGAINEIQKKNATITINVTDLKKDDVVVEPSTDGKTMKVLRGYRPIPVGGVKEPTTPVKDSTPAPQPKHDEAPIPPDPGATNPNG